jgi:enduracididine biosynthesis enzyme MppP
VTAKLTTLENAALRTGLNVSDGHPRMPLTQGQRAIVSGLGELYDDALKLPFDELEAETHRAFLHGLGQYSAPVGTGRLVSCYSSSVAIDLLARALAERTSHVAVIHPTFDNIPDLLKSRHLSLVPVSEGELEAGELQLPPEVGAVFATCPNNPTGWVASQEQLARLAGWCAATGRILALDTCFRAHDERAQYDTYRVLEDSGVEWAVVEDTGKLWPVLELKAGFLSWGPNTSLPIADAFDDLLLSVSPLILSLLTRLAQDAAAGGYAELRELIAGNRAILAEAIEGSGLTLKEPGSRISLAQVSLPPAAGQATDIYQAMLAQGIHVLPCDAFHWADPDGGTRDIRISLARAPQEVRTAAQALARAADGTGSSS